MRSGILVALGILLPWMGTALGALGALLPRMRSARLQTILGFSAGIMLATSVWSLLIPAAEGAAAAGLIPWLVTTAGFLAGAGCVRGLNRILAEKTEGELLFWAVTLHNIPEGMAVGVAFAAALGGDGRALAGALALAFGIAVQDIPEGGIIALPLAMGGMKKRRACAVGALSGAVEPLAALGAMLLAGLSRAVLPWVLSAAAGCMFFVAVESLLPREGNENPCGAVAVSGGFALMMLLDLCFS